MGEPCEYCLEDPCTCPVFDIPDEFENPDDPIDDDADNGPLGDEP